MEKLDLYKQLIDQCRLNATICGVPDTIEMLLDLARFFEDIHKNYGCRKPPLKILMELYSFSKEEGSTAIIPILVQMLTFFSLAPEGLATTNPADILKAQEALERCLNILRSWDEAMKKAAY